MKREIIHPWGTPSVFSTTSCSLFSGCAGSSQALRCDGQHNISATHHAVVSGFNLLTHSALSLAAFEQRNNHIRAVHQHRILPRHGVGVHLLRQIRMHIGAVAVHITLGNRLGIGEGSLLVLTLVQDNKLPASVVVQEGAFIPARGFF